MRFPWLGSPLDGHLIRFASKRAGFPSTGYNHQPILPTGFHTNLFSMPTANLNKSHRVYCAGPLFNRSEREEMTAIAEALERAGYAVYLPHRDGMEFRLVHRVLIEQGWPSDQAGQLLHAAIFALDVYQLAVECGALVWNLNGRTPDEGAVCEAAIAWTLGKPLVAYSDDARSLIAGRLNPLLHGLVDFRTVDEIAAIPAALAEAVARSESSSPPDTFPPGLSKAIREGRTLWKTMTERGAQHDDRRIAEAVTEVFGPADARGLFGTARNAPSAGR